jgi:hypothetical protein
MDRHAQHALDGTSDGSVQQSRGAIMVERSHLFPRRPRGLNCVRDVAWKDLQLHRLLEGLVQDDGPASPTPMWILSASAAAKASLLDESSAG